MQNTYEKLNNDTVSIAVVGLGYVGLPLALAFAKHFKVIGYDINADKVKQYRLGKDATFESGDQKVADSTIKFTSDETRLKEADFIIVAVPTPINEDKSPDLGPVIAASEIVGRNLKTNAIVIYESTVYPGVTEEICQPILEQNSAMRCGCEFKIGYSPERINPGDKVHTFEKIQKIVSGMDEESLIQIQKLYNSVVEAGTYPVSSIQTAEAIKLIENSQRDANIAFMNEIAMALEPMGIDTNEVVDGMNTKWNALGFRPGLVGGHCIGVDPYYFIYRAKQFGYSSKIVSASRTINDSVSHFIAEMCVKKMIQIGIHPAEARIVILGITFKENCSDVRNTRVVDIINELQKYYIKPPIVVDPYADSTLVKNVYDIELTDLNQIHDADCVIHAVSHHQFLEMGTEGIYNLYRKSRQSPKLLMDIKGQWSIIQLKELGITWWRM